jgi:crossover junction endodeoxyribonuclease RusA
MGNQGRSTQREGRGGTILRLCLTLPYPPTVNHYWCVGNGHIYVSAQGKAYVRQVKRILEGAPKVKGKLQVTVLVSPPDRRERDIDNILKCLLDSITRSGVWKSDSHIVVLMMYMLEPESPGSVELIVEPITE